MTTKYKDALARFDRLLNAVDIGDNEEIIRFAHTLYRNCGDIRSSLQGKINASEHTVEDLMKNYSDDYVEVGSVNGGWLPMESAPKDGTCVIVWYENNCEMAYFKDRIEMDEPYWVSHRGQRGITPTHYQPLPTPPKENNND